MGRKKGFGDGEINNKIIKRLIVTKSDLNNTKLNIFTLRCYKI
jgi:hypothetical protein